MVCLCQKNGIIFLNKIKDEKKAAVLVTVLGTKLTVNIIAPAKPTSKSYKQLVEVMKSHLDLKPIVIAEYFYFIVGTRKREKQWHNT